MNKWDKQPQKISDSLHDEHVDEKWLVSYADMMTLLFGFFVLMYSLSRIDVEKYTVISKDLAMFFGGKTKDDWGMKVAVDDIEDYLKTKVSALRKKAAEEEKAQIEAYGGLEEIMKRLEELLQEQKDRHQGGNTWIGTGGTSAFGHGGYNPQGVRVGGSGGQKSAIKIWEKRQFRDYADDLELNTRNIKMALRRLRILTRDGIQNELDLHTTIDHTCRNAGYIDIVMQASKKNKVKVLLFFDVGGSMDPHIELCSQIFSAAKSEFKHLEFYYFHNCIYESVWKNNSMRWEDKIPTLDILHKYNGDYKVIIVGDATMSPYELTHTGGSIEHHNDESGTSWLNRLKEHFPYTVWINPSSEAYWQGTKSIEIVQSIFPKRMFPMTMEGLSKAMKELKGKKLRV